jgi:protein-arginine kinase activator protein McsA
MLAKCISTEEYERAAEIKAAIDEKRRQQKQEKI